MKLLNNPKFWLFPLLVILLILGYTSYLLFFPPQLVSPQLPLSGTTSFSPSAPLTLRFNRPVHPLVRGQLTPAIDGFWSLTRSRYSLFPNTLIFSPTLNPPANTEVLVTLDHILPLGWLNFQKQSKSIAFILKTHPAATLNALNPPESRPEFMATYPTPTYPATHKLPIPQYYQHHTYTCYSAAAKMALAYRGVTIDEIGFLSEIGFDSTKRNYATNLWGDPNQGIVGAMDGNQGGGYGAHWQPVANAISKYRPVEVKQNWNLTDLLATVATGSPVMVWWVNGVWPAKDISWNTSNGRVYTVNGMHVEVVTGYEGLVEKPQLIYTNDPWRGARQYHPDTFSNLWRWFSNTAIVIN